MICLVHFDDAITDSLEVMDIENKNKILAWIISKHSCFAAKGPFLHFHVKKRGQWMHCHTESSSWHNPCCHFPQKTLAVFQPWRIALCWYAWSCANTRITSWNSFCIWCFKEHFSKTDYLAYLFQMNDSLPYCFPSLLWLYWSIHWLRWTILLTLHHVQMLDDFAWRKKFFMFISLVESIQCPLVLKRQGLSAWTSFEKKWWGSRKGVYPSLALLANLECL